MKLEDKDKNIEVLMTLLECAEDKNLRAVILQSYIQEEGYVPIEYADKIRELLDR